MELKRTRRRHATRQRYGDSVAGRAPVRLAFAPMPRPKTILWVDDEVDGLAAHRRFLEEQGFVVEQAAHGDDALALLRRQPYSVVLLDEQMPGRRGLELLGEIRAIDPAMPVVMVTQSEDQATLREAIGIEVDDYLVKPVHPRQILSVVTRLVEGDRIRQQRLARDFVTRFRELEARRGGALAWREWIELVVELVRWEVKLSAGNEPGLSEALGALQLSLRKDFAEFIKRNYPRWLAHPEADRPPLSADVGAEFLVPILQASNRALFIVVDCLRLDQWETIRELVTPLFDVEESHYYSILPTATPFSRNAIFSGMFPMEIAARHPEWWGKPSDEESLNSYEPQLLAEQLEDLMGRPVPVRYEKLFSAADGGDLLRRLPAHLAQDGVTALVFNFIDLLTHGRSESAILYEVARDTAALRSLTRTWFERSPLRAALEEAERRGVTVLLTTDHGSIHCETPATVFAKRDTTANLRYKFGEDLRAEDPEAAIAVDDLKAWGLPALGLGVRMLLATGDRFFVYPTKLREYQARYRGSFLHGGVSPEEVILPVALLTPRRAGRGAG
jgi:DNA-binding response OmpR family regulator